MRPRLVNVRPMARPDARATDLVAAWQKRSTRPAAAALRAFYAKHARELPLAQRAEICIALGEASELEGYFEIARYLFASAVSAADPQTDERMRSEERRVGKEGR